MHALNQFSRHAAEDTVKHKKAARMTFAERSTTPVIQIPVLQQHPDQFMIRNMILNAPAPL